MHVESDIRNNFCDVSNKKKSDRGDNFNWTYEYDTMSPRCCHSLSGQRGLGLLWQANNV